MRGKAEVTTVKCILCGKEDEGILLSIQIWIFTVKAGICEGCVSKLFRKFSKKR